MFTGIIQGYREIVEVETKPGLTSFAVDLSDELLTNLSTGASIAVDGVCLTVTKLHNTKAYFDAMEETLRKTTIGSVKIGRMVSIERSSGIGDEIGGHIVSGHVNSMATIVEVKESENNRVVTFQCEPEWMKYIFSKGFIALDGASLTVVDVNKDTSTFSIYFIPETLKRTTFGTKKESDLVNLEIDMQTHIIVDTVERILQEKHIS